MADTSSRSDLQSFVEQTSSPAWRTTILTITLLLTSFFSWMAFSEVEEVVLAEGQVEPISRVKVINHPEGGRVAAIEVREGDRVAAGDILLRLDPALRENERREVQTRYQQSVMEVARLEAEVAGTGIVIPEKMANERPDLVTSQDRMLEANLDAYSSEAQTLTDMLDAKEGEMRSARAQTRKLAGSLELLGEQVTAVRDLAEQGFYPRLKLVELERELTDTQGELERARAEESAATSALAEARSRLAEHEKSHRRTLLADLEAAKSNRDVLRHQLQGQATRVDDLLVRAPTAGIVQELEVTAIGQAVAAHDKLMKLVPIGEGLIIRAAVKNDDIGRVRRDMPATVKVHAYDFKRHGALDGTVADVAADSRPDAEGVDLVYDVRVVTNQSHLGDQAGGLQVIPGMRVDVELKIGERTILSYLTDQIIQIREETFREG